MTWYQSTKKGSEYIVKQTSQSFAAPYPTNFKKKKISLTLQVFDEIKVAASNLTGSVEAVRFIMLKLLIWKCLNKKSPEPYCMFFIEDRKLFTNENDPRLVYLKSSVIIFMSIGIFGQTTDTSSNPLHITLNGIVKLTAFFLTKVN